MLIVMPVLADGGNDSSTGSRLKAFQELIEKQQFQQAIKELDTALQDDPDDADLLNLLAYSHRQLEHFDIALDYYQQALKIKPKHRGANEYLGELYLILGQLEKAEERLAVLDKACFFGCGEYDELKQAIREYRRKNPS
jgi:Flp pilus assembly protein TadD